MNCYNDYNGDGLPENCCPGGATCLYSLASGNYGLSLNLSNNKISGYAWSSNLGWICFGATCATPTPDGYLSWACKGDNVSGNTCIGEGNKVFGWTKVMWSNQPNDG